MTTYTLTDSSERDMRHDVYVDGILVGHISKGYEIPTYLPKPEPQKESVIYGVPAVPKAMWLKAREIDEAVALIVDAMTNSVAQSESRGFDPDTLIPDGVPHVNLNDLPNTATGDKSYTNRYGSDGEPCIVCGRYVNTGKAHYRARMLTSLTFVPHWDVDTTDYGDHDQGSHAIGSECVKSLPQGIAYKTQG